MSRDKQIVAENEVERWVLARFPFIDCRKCGNRKRGCHKDYKFVKAYKERNER